MRPCNKESMHTCMCVHVALLASVCADSVFSLGNLKHVGPTYLLLYKS